MLRSEATRDLPADWADGHMSMHMCVTLDADADDPASILAASLVAAQLQKVWWQFRCTPFCDPATMQVRLAMHADLDDIEESEWSCALSEGMENLWDDGGGCSDCGRALSLVKEDTERQLVRWVAERSEELGIDLLPKIDVSVHNFDVWQE